MRKIVIILVIIFGLSSCNAWNKYVQSKCQRNDSTYVIETTKWDTAIVYSPYEDITFDTTSNEIPPNVVIHHSEKKGGLNASFTIKNSKITFKCSEDSLKHEIAYLQKQIESHKVQTTYVYCEKDHVTAWLQFCFWHTILSWCLVIIWVIIKAFR